MLNVRRYLVNTNRFGLNKLTNSTDVNKLAADNYTVASIRQLHTSQPNCNLLASAAQLPLPDNIDAAETTRFSPNRTRDIAADVMHMSEYGANCIMPKVDITIDSSNTSANSGVDPHLQSYDCFGAVSLNASMQSNVPSPFGGMHGFTHLNMPGGQWSQESKFTSQNLQSSHYLTLREQVREQWLHYNQNAVVSKAHATNSRSLFSTESPSTSGYHCVSKVSSSGSVRSYSSKPEVKENNQPKIVLSRQERLKSAIKEYGSTIIVFHVGISLISLGCCYLLVSGGIDMLPILEYLGLSSSASLSKITAGASTFVVAYTIHKIFAPIRISITLGAAPFIVRYLRSKGLLSVKIVKQK